MSMGIKSPTTVLFMALAIVSLLGIACLPPDQPPVSNAELQEIVRAEVSSQVATISIGDSNGPGELDALRAEFEIAVMEPLNNLQGEIEDLRNQFFGGNYASNLDIDGLRLELEQVGSMFHSLEFEFARLEQLEELRFEVESIRFSSDPQAEFDLRSDLEQFNFEFQSIRDELEAVGRHIDLELEQLRLETEEVRRFIESVDRDLRIETDSLHRRLEAFR